MLPLHIAEGCLMSQENEDSGPESGLRGRENTTKAR